MTSDRSSATELATTVDRAAATDLASEPQAARTTRGPLSRVLDAVASGAASRAQVARRTALDSSTVDAALDHLVRIGRVRSESLGSGCPDQGCGGCSSGRADGTAGCGAMPATARGPVLLTLITRSG